MSLLRLPITGLDMEAEQTITQFVIPAGAGATYSASNNIATITFNAAHGLTLSPSAGVPPNYFITFGGSTSGQTGTGVLVGNIFRILSIPSTTAITIYCTITALTVTSLTGIPVFFPELQIGNQSAFLNGPVQTPATAGTYSPPIPKGCTINCNLGANCAVRYNPDNTAIILDAQSTAALPGGTTPAVAPTWRDLIPASSSGQATLFPPGMGIWANGTTATSRFSQIQ
jgi:hypothetical protein